MLYKLLVKQFTDNINNIPLKDKGGQDVKENYKDISFVIGKVPLVVEKEVIKDLEGKVITTEEEVEVVDMKERIIIPSRVKATEFFVYQEIDITDGYHSLVGYYDEDGNVFSFDSSESVYESSIIDEKPELPSWYKK